MALATSVLQRLPLSTSLLYLATGYAVGPAGLGLLDLDPLRSSAVLERITEVAVIVSLFTAGLKLRLPLTAPAEAPSPGRACTPPGVRPCAWPPSRWCSPWPWWRAAPGGSSVCPWGRPSCWGPSWPRPTRCWRPTCRSTTPPTATASASASPARRASTTAPPSPSCMLGLGLLGLHELGPLGPRWLAVDVVWGVLAGLLVGGLLGTAVSRLVLYLRREHREAVGLDDFLALGLIVLAYGAALLAHGYGFLAVFAAGLALRRIERQHTEEIGGVGGSGGAGERPRRTSRRSGEHDPEAGRGGPGHRPGEGPGLHGPGGAGLQRAAGAHRRGGGGDPPGGDALLRATSPCRRWPSWPSCCSSCARWRSASASWGATSPAPSGPSSAGSASGASGRSTT